MTIGLAMLVRDEAEVIDATLARIRPVIDTWTVIDTGSVDDTADRVRHALNDLPGALYEQPWINFGHNRTQLLHAARATGSDYTLLLDADHVLHVEGEQPDLDADSYLLRVRGSMEWRLPLLTRTAHPFEYRGAAHSYLASELGACVTENTDWLSIDGGRSPSRDKFERDRLLLEQERTDDPDNARAVFYLAQTYRDLDEPALAAAAYSDRVGMGGWDEEVFWARYQEALCRQTLGVDPTLLLLDAYERRPSRIEPLYVLAKHHHDAGHHATARIFAEQAVKQLDAPTDDRLFVLQWMYDSAVWDRFLAA